MIPFPGESMPISFGWSSDGDDWTLVDDIVERALSRTITAGDEWRVWCYAGDQVYLDETGLALSISWVIEVLSGTATLTLTDGIDAAGDHDTGAALSNSLGTVNVTGPGTYVITASFTGAEVESYATGELELSIVCTSGSCDVQQVKLRVWPASGVVGGYVTFPAWDQETLGDVYAAGSGITLDAQETGADNVEAWDNLETALPGAVTAWNASAHVLDWAAATGNLVNSVGRIRSVLIGLGVYGAQILDTPVAAAVVGPNLATTYPIAPSLTPGVDFIYPPTEVYGDVAVLAILLGSATLTWGEFGALFSMSYTPTSGAPSTSPGGGLAVAVSGSSAFPGDGSSASFALSGGAFVTPTDDVTPGSASLSLGGGSSQTILAFMNFTGDVTLPDFSSWVPNGIDNPTADYTYGALVDDPPVTVHHPPYRLWVPSAGATPLRQFHRDDGLGVTPPRAFGGASRIHTGRAFGYD